ncbi:MAG: methyltransferase [Acidaminococcales bacterium]|jgi:tRNA1(Val) A37 N6-methylase TrmN6|nr:methyltransferase [Acidaminococcales bacterium]
MERLDRLPNGWPIWQCGGQFKFTLDAVLLAAFPLLRANAKVIDLGAGTGAVSLLLAARGALSITGVDNNEDVVGLFSRSIAENRLDGVITARAGDVREIKTLFPAGSFDLAVANPPYRKIGHGRLRQGGARSACHEVTATAGDFIGAARHLLKYGGRLALSHLPERLPEVLCACAKFAVEPKKLQLVHSRSGRAPSVFLLEAVRGGKPGLKVLPPLFVYAGENEYSGQLLACYGLFGREKPAG